MLARWIVWKRWQVHCNGCSTSSRQPLRRDQICGVLSHIQDLAKNASDIQLADILDQLLAILADAANLQISEAAT